MNRHLLLSAAAAAVIGLSVQGCSKNQQAATSNTADATASATSNAASGAADATGNAMGATGNAVGSAEGTGPVSDVQDTAGAAVGMASAAMPTTTQGFVDAAGISDMYEIQAAKMAETRATLPDLKKFAKQMVTDHTKSSTELKSLVSKGGVKATPPAKLDQRRQGMLDNLKTSKDGDEFNKRYINQQVAAHREAATLFKGFANHGDNDQLKAFAAKTAPVIQGHLDMIEGMAKQPNSGETGKGQ